MAVFRGITAEEEAASGLMHALISRKYPNAELLRPRDHLQKHAVIPFLRALLDHLREIKLDGLCSVRLAITSVDGFDRLVVLLLLDGEELTAMPVPPLNLSVREGDGGEFPNITRNVRALLGPTGYSNVLCFLRNEANLRNRILYAGPDGYPQVHDLQPEYLMERQRRVFAILKAALLILPYEQIQPLAAEALESFLRLIEKLKDLPESTNDG